MSIHNIMQELANAKVGDLPFKGVEGAAGFYIGIVDGADPVAADNYAPGACVIRVDTPELIVNTGSKASPTWTAAV